MTYRILRLGALVVLALVAVQALTGTATAAVTVAINPNPVVYPNTSIITVSAVETDGGNGNVVVSVSGGSIALGGCTTSGATQCSNLTANGGGTQTITVTTATDGDGATGEVVTLLFTFSPPSVSTTTSFPVSACQGGACTPAQMGTVSVLPAGTVITRVISVITSFASMECDFPVTVTVHVSDSGVDVANGTVVQLTSNAGGPALMGTTTGGTATFTLTSPLGLNGSWIITATAGVFTGQAVIQVRCDRPGPPGQISLITTPASITCGSTASVLATVLDRFGNAVANGTTISFTSTLGSLPGSILTSAGQASAVLTSFPTQPGTAQIVVRGGDVSAQSSVQIVCVGAASPTPPPLAPTQVPPALPTLVPATTAPVVSGITPPNTGDGGLR